MRFLHAMLRVSHPQAAIRFFNLLGLEELSADEIRFILDTADSCCDDGQSRRRRFEHHPRKSFPARGQQQQIEAAHGSRNIAPPSR